MYICKESIGVSEWMIKQKDACSDIGIANDMSGSKGVRQNLVKRWIPNGGIYVIRTNFLLKHKKCIDDETLIYEMSKLNSLDIDDEDDFILCESLIKSGFINKN